MTLHHLLSRLIPSSKDKTVRCMNERDRSLVEESHGVYLLEDSSQVWLSRSLELILEELDVEGQVGEPSIVDNLHIRAYKEVLERRGNESLQSRLL